MNSFGNVIRPLSWFIAVSLAAVVAGCGGGGGDSAPAAPVVVAKPIGDIAGAWTITETEITSVEANCTPPRNPLTTYPVTFTQTGNTVTVAGDRASNTPPTTFAGTIKGNAVTWSGPYREQGGIGTTTLNSVNSTVAPDCNTLDGTSAWTFVQDAPATFTCTASTKFTGTRNTASGCTPAQSAS